MRAILLRICYEYPLIFRDKQRWNIFFSALFGTGSQEGVELLSRHTGMGWWNSVDSIREVLLHLDWLYQPRENRKESLVGTQFHHGVAMWVHSGKDFRAASFAKAPPPHHPLSSTSPAWRSCRPPHTLQKAQCLQLQILPTVTRNCATSPQIFFYCYKGPCRGRFCCKSHLAGEKHTA